MPKSANTPLVEVAAHVARCLARHPELLGDPYRAQVADGAHPLTGHCYVASEALYYMGAKGEGYRPHVMRLDEGGTHWYLMNPEGHVLDPTAAQFDQAVDYQAGRCCGFLTKRPSKRTRRVQALVMVRGPKVERTSPLVKQHMRWATWSQRVHGYLGSPCRKYANTIAGLESMLELYKDRVAPREAARSLEREALGKGDRPVRFS